MKVVLQVQTWFCFSSEAIRKGSAGSSCSMVLVVLLSEAGSSGSAKWFC